MEKGDRIISKPDEENRLTQLLETRDPLKGILGFLHDYAKDRPVTVEEMKSDIRAKAAEKYGGRKPS